MTFINSIANIIKKLRVYTIKRQIFLAMTFVSLFSGIILTIIFYFLANDNMKEYYKEINNENLKVYSRIFDIKMNNIILRLRGTFFDPLVLDIMRNDYNGFASNYYNNSDSLVLSGLFTGYDNMQEFPVVGMYIFDLHNRRYIRPSGTTYYNEYTKYNNVYIEKDSFWYQYTLSNNGKEVFFGYDVLVPENNEYISISKSIRDTRDQKFIGIVVITFEKRILWESLIGASRSNISNSFFITDERNEFEFIFIDNLSSTAKKATEEYSLLIKKEKSLDNRNYLFMKEQNFISGWYFVNGMDKRKIMPASHYLMTSIIIIFIFNSLLWLFISNLISRKIYEPFKSILKIIDNIGVEALPGSDFFDSSETGRISKALISSINRNRQLSERLLKIRLKEKEVELALLQSQINPHFLYNTMESIYSLALIHNADDIAIMVADLSDMFKMALNKGKPYIKLGEEIVYIKKYIAIQNIRFNGRFLLQIDIEKSLYECYILKLLLQPLVENAIYHGLEPKIGQGKINIFGSRNNDCINLIISDDGVGFTNLQEQLNNGYAIQNVRKRVQLFYGTEYDIIVESTEGKGATIILNLPVLSEEQYCSKLGIAKSTTPP